MESGPTRNEASPARRQATVLESVEEVRAHLRGEASRTVRESALLARTARGASPLAAPDPTEVGAGVPHPADAGAGETPVYRPGVRPPMGLLHVLDDGETVGEVVRVRAGSFVIGRVEGSLVIPHDQGLSGRHAEILRRGEGDHWSWLLRDLGSTNGTFARASSIVLAQGQEFLIGGRLFRFEAPAPGPSEGAGASSQATRKWEVPARAGADAGAGAGPAVLVEVAKGAELRRHTLPPGEHWIGREARTCSVVVDDPYVDPRHARIACDARGRWAVVNARSRNGLWGRVSEVALDRGGAFQCGEQRFLFRVL